MAAKEVRGPGVLSTFTLCRSPEVCLVANLKLYSHQTTPPPSPPQPWESLVYSVSINVTTLDILRKWNDTVFVLL